MRRTYIYTFMTEFFVLISAIITLKLAAAYMGPEGFGEYVLARRIISLLSFTLLLGLGISIPRYIAFGSANHLPSPYLDAYFVSGALVGVIVFVVSSLLINLFDNAFAYLFFGNGRYVHLILSVTISMGGVCLHSIIYGYYRGHLMMARANLLQLANMGIAPPLAFVLSNKTTSAVLSVIGICWLVISGVGAYSILRTVNIKEIRADMLIKSSKQLLAYGIVRVPGEFSLMGLFAFPTTFTAHVGGIVEAGFVSFGISLVNMIGSLFSAIGLIFLPLTSRLVAEGKLVDFKELVFKSLKISMGVTFGIVVLCEILVDRIITVFLGGEFSGAASYVRPLLIGAIPYIVYIILRNPLDAAHVWPFNTINLLISLLVLVILLFSRGFPVQIALPITLSILGSLTLYSITRSIKGKMR